MSRTRKGFRNKAQALVNLHAERPTSYLQLSETQ